MAFEVAPKEEQHYVFRSFVAGKPTARLWAMMPKSIKGCDIKSLVHPGDYAENMQMVERLLSGEIPHSR